MARITPLALPLVAAGTLAGACSRPDASPPAEVGTARTDTAAATGPAGLKVAAVMIGKRVGPGNLVTEPTFEFSSRDTVHVSVATEGSGAGTLTAAWRSRSGEILQKTSEQTGGPGENAVFSLAQPKGLKPGTYKVVVFLVNDSVDTKVFVVKK
jgi:hypothetical protein